MLNFLFKLILLIIILLILSQLEYKGRKVQTYAEEFVKSFKGKKDIAKTIQQIKETEDDHITEEDRKQLMDVLE